MQDAVKGWNILFLFIKKSLDGLGYEVEVHGDGESGTREQWVPCPRRPSALVGRFCSEKWAGSVFTVPRHAEIPILRVRGSCAHFCGLEVSCTSDALR